MITINFYLDCRKTMPGNPAPLKINVCKDRVRSYIPVGIKILPCNWNQKNQTCTDLKTDILLKHRLSVIQNFIFRLESEGRLRNFSAVEIKDLIVEEFFKKTEYSNSVQEPQDSTFLKYFKRFRDSKTGRTKDIYETTLKRLKAYIGEKALAKLEFEDITVRWLKDFDLYMSKTSPSPNARNIHFRNIRAVFNDALADEVISCYPFRRFKLKSVPTRKRCLDVEDLRTLFNYKVEPYAEFYRDMFKLIFMLIGINTVDLYGLKSVTKDGRIDYIRSKTKKHYSIKVEPEAMEIIKKYKGKCGLLKITDRWLDHHQFVKQMNHALKVIGSERKGLGGKKKEGLFPEISSYWARHSWATIAADLDVPDAVISQALGHAPENRITEIYIRRNPRKVDEANRKVLDWVLYGKR